jgi:Tat protein secretion system quality control protein TatD with DNase activity
VETDAPFITPIPKDIIFTVKKIAEIRAIGLEELAEKIYSNTVEFLKLEALKEGHQTRLAQIEQPTK